MKKGYVLLQVNVNDPEVFKKYPELSEKIISKFGGKYLFRGGKFEVLEGSWDFKRNVLLEFENISKAQEWYNSSEYQEAKRIGKGEFNRHIQIVEGV